MYIQSQQIVSEEHGDVIEDDLTGLDKAKEFVWGRED